VIWPIQKSLSPSVVVRDWLLSLSDGRKRVRSLKLQLFWTFAGLLPSTPTSVPGERLSFTDICLLFTLWPRGLAIRTRSRKLNFWLQERKEEGWKRPGSGKGQINRKIIKHGMKRKRYSTKVWLNQNSRDGLFWTCKLPFLSFYQIHPVKQYFFCHDLDLTWIFFAEAPQTVLYLNCIKRTSCNTNPIPRFAPISKQRFEAWLSVHPSSVATFNVEQPDNISISRLARPDVEAQRGMS